MIKIPTPEELRGITVGNRPLAEKQQSDTAKEVTEQLQLEAQEKIRSRPKRRIKIVIKPRKEPDSPVQKLTRHQIRKEYGMEKTPIAKRLLAVLINIGPDGRTTAEICANLKDIDYASITAQLSQVYKVFNKNGAMKRIKVEHSNVNRYFWYGDEKNLDILHKQYLEGLRKSYVPKHKDRGHVAHPGTGHREEKFERLEIPQYQPPKNKNLLEDIAERLFGVNVNVNVSGELFITVRKG